MSNHQKYATKEGKTYVIDNDVKHMIELYAWSIMSDIFLVISHYLNYTVHYVLYRLTIVQINMVNKFILNNFCFNVVMF